MAYFDNDFISFFKGLAAKNTKDYFDANRKIYIKKVKEPFQSLIMDAAAALSKYDPKMKELQLKNAMFRINRDIRFSKDKSLYKLHMGAVISPYGRKDMQYPGLYLHLGIGDTHMGGGMYMPDKDNLAKIRQAIIKDSKGLEKALNTKEFKRLYGNLAEADKNKILPKPFKEYGDDHPLLFNKQFYYMAHYEDENFALREDLLDVLVDHYAAGHELNQWFKKALS